MVKYCSDPDGGTASSPRIRSGLLGLGTAVLMLAGVAITAGSTAGAVDPPVTITAGAIAASPEGDAGTHAFQLPVTLSAPAAATVTVDYSTIDFSALGFAKEGADFLATSGTLTFNPGETSENIPVTVIGDTIDEPPFLGGEWGFVRLTNPSSNAVIDNGGFFGLGVFVIIDDDPPPTIIPGVAVVTEGDVGTVPVDVPVTLSNPSATEVTVDWTTKDLLANPAVAVGGVDYVADSGTVTFAPGDTSEVVSIQVIGDTDVEPPLGGTSGEWGLVFFDNASPNAMVDPSFFMLGVFVIEDDDANVPPTIVPSSYSTIGNVQLRVDDNPGGAVGSPSSPFIEATPDQPLADNSDPDSTLTAQAGVIATANGGSVDINTDGTFLYTPPLGFEGPDTFTYTVLEDGVDNGATEIVAIDVADVVWFVDNSAGVGDGGSDSPFNSLAPLNVGGDPDEAGDVIFVYDGVSGTTPYDGGIVLETDQQLLGEGGGLILTDSNDATQSLTIAAGTRPTLTNAAGNGIDLASGNTVRGLDISAPSGSGVLGLSIANFSLDSVGVNGPAGAGIDLQGTGGSFSLTALDVTGSGGTGLDLDLGGSSLSITDTAVDNSLASGGGVRIANAASTGVSISGVSVGGSTVVGVDLSANTGTFSLSGIDVTTSGVTGFSASSSGILLVPGTGNRIDALSAAGLSVVNTTIGTGGLNFESISSNGAGTGIVLNNTGSGGFTITGDGGTAQNGSGGVISGSVVDGIQLANVDDVSLNQVRIDLSSSGRHGISGTGVDGFSLTNSEILNSGNANEENAIDFTSPASSNLIGTAALDNVSVSNFEDIALDINNTTGSLDLTVSNSTFTDNDDVNGGEAIAVESNGTATFDVQITDNLFDNIESDVVTLRALGSGGPHDIHIVDNTSTNGGGPDDFPSGGGMSIVLANSSDVTFDIQGNVLTNAIQGIRVTGDGSAEGRIGGPLTADGNSITLRADVGAGSGDSIEIDMGGSSLSPSTGETWTILIQNNTLGDDAGSPTPGADGIGVLHRDSNGTLNVTIEDNTISNIDDQAIDVFTDEDAGLGAGPFSLVRIVDNGFVNLADDAIEVDTDETAEICLHIAGNDNGVGGSPGTFDLDQRNEPATVLEITQASTAALSTANAGANVVPTGTITFNGGCTNPPLPTN